MKQANTLYQWAARIAHQNNARAKRFGATGRLAVRDWIDCLKEAKGKCPACKRVVGWWSFELDHIVALAAGGTNKRENIRAICRPCNSRKTDAPMEIAHSEEYITAKEARKIGRWKIATIHKMIRRGTLKGVITNGGCFVLKQSVISEALEWERRGIYAAWDAVINGE